MVVVFGQGYGAGIGQDEIAFFLQYPNVGMALDEDVPGVFGEVVEAVFMAMGQGDGFVEGENRGDLAEEEFGDHLIDLGIAVAFDGDELIRVGVDHSDDVFGGIILRRVVPSSVIEEIP